MRFAAAMAVAVALDALLGWPGGLFARIGHPVIWLGALIGALDRRWNRTADAPWRRRVAGVAAALVVIALAAGLGWAVQTDSRLRMERHVPARYPRLAVRRAALAA